LNQALDTKSEHETGSDDQLKNEPSDLEGHNYLENKNVDIQVF
jgi:hypothetical protein